MTSVLYNIEVFFKTKNNELNTKIFKKYLSDAIFLDDIKELFFNEVYHEIVEIWPNCIIIKIEVSKILGTRNVFFGTIDISEQENIQSTPSSVILYEKINVLSSSSKDITIKQKETLIEILNLINKYSNVKIILDTNIFILSPNFIEILTKLDTTIFIVNDTYEEINRIKNRSNYQDNNWRNSRFSLRLIERMEKENKIVIDGNINIQNNSNVYADQKIIKWVEKNIKNDYIIAIINDTDLRIRIKMSVKNMNMKNKISIIELDDKI